MAKSEAELHRAWCEAYDRWCQSHSEEDARKLAQAAIDGGLSWYETTGEGTRNLGADGWREWLQEQERTSDIEAKVTYSRQPAAYVPEPAPWEVLNERCDKPQSDKRQAKTKEIEKWQS